MTNSMSNVEFVKALIIQHVRPHVIDIIDQHQIGFEVDQNEIHLLLLALKNAGWIQMSYLSAIDWPGENKFEVVYVLFNWDKPVYVQLRTKIDRTNPVIDSIIQIYPGAKYYERECHEFFGIAFPGNPDHHKQLILEQWDDIPPLRKDFDPKAYSDRKFPQRTYTEDYSLSNSESTKVEKRKLRKQRAESLKGGKKQ